MFQTTDPKQPFFVLNKIDLFPTDEEILIKLYQPLVGATAISLFQTIIQNFNPYSIISDAEGIYSLQEQLDCGLKDLFTALHKLEAVGLIQTYLVENKISQVICFKVRQVPPASDYFADSLLVSLLKQKVGESRFHSLSKYFAQKARLTQKKVENARDVSANFIEVFSLPENEAISPSADVLQAKADNSEIKPVEAAEVNQCDNIDWQYMKDQYARYNIPSIQIDKNKSGIRAIIQTYGLTEQDFISESLPSLRGQNELNLRQIERLLADSYRSSHTRKQINRQVEQDSSVKLQSIFSEKEKKLYRMANQSAPVEFLYQLKSEKGGFVSPGEKRVLNVLKRQYGLPSDLINVLIYACLSYDSMVSSNLAYRIANDWLQHKVVTSSQAIQYLRQRRNKPKRYYIANRSAKRVEKGTDWSKKKAANDSNVKSEDLKEFFKNLENRNQNK